MSWVAAMYLGVPLPAKPKRKACRAAMVGRIRSAMAKPHKLARAEFAMIQRQCAGCGRCKVPPA